MTPFVAIGTCSKMPMSFTEIYHYYAHDFRNNVDFLESRRAGTLPFISIGILEKERHGYRYDLESFLYVLLWLCCEYEGDDNWRKRMKIWV
ncbi:hypothetical protein BC936DRAFT_138214 [Jimgerdemannia flammicorona]|uniref:Fungal-type protein kinase domain-containing protein n=1 Tax=Jimgerdemannia flammicorona TaxID=994334 RepID=A0A433CVV6_9FUNG|nr:hypothetical protein BC936DRAFT_138214 [Jimgerdemannia flammicorona]